jgi:OOP family OmpA-OmpF porin
MFPRGAATTNADRRVGPFPQTDRLAAMPDPERHPDPPGTIPPGPDEFELVRELLLGREKTQISRLEERLENPELRAQDVSRVLPEAVRACAVDGDRLARALTPSVETALQESVRRSPSILTNAIFPIIGPAIRRASAEAISRLVQAVNQALDHSLSLRGLKWRLEALRTGRSYAEIVLSRTLIYRVNQVFLIQRSTGLLLQHVAPPGVTPQNADVVSGMLTAIHEFVTESFTGNPGEGLHTLDVGGLSVWVETGPHAILAAVIHGHAPNSLRLVLQSALERIHRDFAFILPSGNARSEALEATAPILADCLLEQGSQPAQPSFRAFWLATTVLVVLAGVWAYSVLRDNHRWANYLNRLASEEGIVVSASAKQGGRFHLVGWRDPLAIDPASLLGAFHVPTNRVVAHWEPYQGITPGLVLRRSQRVLQPPEGVGLRFESGTLHAEGIATKTWVDQAKSRAQSLPGVEAFDASRVFDPVEAELSASIQHIEATLLSFGETTRLIPGQEEILSRLISELKALQTTADRAGRRFQVLIQGHADRTGTPEYNLRLSQQRAEETRAMLESQGIPPERLRTRGLGALEPLRPDLTPAEEVQNRRVSFRVLLDTAAPVGPNP